jgi:DNA-binding transcriptional ArsR family regulator
MGLSLRSLKDPARYPLQLPWLRRIEPRRSGLDLDVLMALIDDRLWTPDFLNPRPASPLTRIEDDLDRLRRTDPQRLVRQLNELHGGVPEVLRGDPSRALERTAVALHAYWDTCFRPYWLRMRTILEADIVYRGRQIAQGGLASMINGVSPTMAFADNVISIQLRHPLNRIQPVAGRGITLVPTIFTTRASAPIDGSEPPMIMYAARGQGAMWEPETVASDAGAVELLGATRAALLTALAEPASSTELSIRFGVTASAVNQHLRALRIGRLVNSTRYGHSVLYLRSELGAALLGVSSIDDGHITPDLDSSVG